MVQLTTTPRLRRAVRIYNALPTTTTPLPADAVALSHEQIRAVSRALAHHPADSDSGDGDYTFSTLLRGSGIFHAPPAPAPAKTPEYIALMARLRRDEEEREYTALLAAPQHAASTSILSEDEDWKLVKSQISMIFNVLLSVLATAAAVWKVAGAWDVAARLGVAFLAAIVVAVAEVVLLWGYLGRVEEAGEKERQRGKGEVKGATGVSWIVGLGGVVEKRGSSGMGGKG
ncbi:endoplasmic reticulum-based factor for assembly of V-ATPase-domain-containing protein [Tricharina praecox]|uniref:endoplasmic reticulum-based factor for assembly of V-ATPase-domain-containing protein n=1 Tax=Tricharina praecox TaxID=43433 RepID=UPI00221F0DBE|nr:endoplasmic reticulum-based factor for assembly of V-ATPase-domain-containing protein [Tricharina praecox]KAI5851893.1 endoplasmic reticulum-based factor for assembly of V-ATPase-domain-containing protein [Tricharina praecox]